MRHNFKEMMESLNRPAESLEEGVIEKGEGFEYRLSVTKEK